MPKSSSDASHNEHQKLGESSREKKTPTVPHHDDRKKESGNAQGKEAAVDRKTSSRSESDPGGAKRCVRYDTETVSYVSGGVLKRVQLKVPALRLHRLDIFATEIRAMARSQLPKKSDSKEKGRNATPAATKPKVSAVSETKHIPVRVTRNNSPPQCKAGLAGDKAVNKCASKQKNKLQSLKKVEVYDDVSDVPLEEYCDADSVQVKAETSATKNKPHESQHKKQKSTGEGKPAPAPHKKHKGEPLETATAEGKRGQPPHKKQKSEPLEDFEDISDTPLDEYGLSEKPSQSASVVNTTERKVAKARDKPIVSKPSDSASKGGSSNSKVSTNKAEKKGSPEAHSSVKTSATDVQPSKAKSNLASTKPTSKPSPASASAKDVLEKRAVKRPGTPCNDHGSKKLKSDANAAKDKVESEPSVSRRSNSSPPLTKKAPTSKPSPCSKNTAATCGLKGTPATKLKAGTTETKEKAKTVAPSVQQKSCSEAIGKTEQDKQGKKPVPCGKSSSGKPTSTLGISKNIPASSSIETAGEVTKAKPSSKGAHESTTSPVTKKVLSTTSPVTKKMLSTTSPVTKKVLPGKLDKKQGPSTKDSSGITASKSGCSGEPTKDLPAAKTVKSVIDAKASQLANKTPPTSIPKASTDAPAAPKGTPGVAKSSSQSVPAKAPLSTTKPFHDTAKAKPANELGMAKPAKDSAKAQPVNDSAKVKPGTCVSSAVAKAALSSKPAKAPASCAKNISEMPVAAAVKALISSASEKQSSQASPRTDKKPQPDLKPEHLKPAKSSVSVPKTMAVENVNTNRSTDKKLNEFEAPSKDTAKSKPPVCSASGIEVRISRSKLPSNEKLPKCSPSLQIHAAAAEILSGTSKSKGNELQDTCEALASEKAEQVRKQKKARLTECTESSVSVPGSDKITPLSSTSKGLCKKKTEEHHPSNNVEAAAAEVTGETSSFQSTATCKGTSAATEVSTETPAPTTDCVSKESPSDIVDTISEAAPCSTDSLHKDKSDSHKTCKSTAQAATEAQEQNTTAVPHAPHVEADVDGSLQSMDVGSKEECQDARLSDRPTIHRDDVEKQQDASETAGQSRENTAFVAAPDATSSGESTVGSTCHPPGHMDENASQMVHHVGDAQEEDDSDSSSINISSARLQKDLLQAEYSTEPSTREDAKPLANTEVSTGAVSVAALPKQTSTNTAQRDSSVSLLRKTTDALVVTGCSEVNDMLLEGSSPSSSAGDMVAGTTHSNSQMPSAVSQGHPQNLDLVKASSEDPASDRSSPDKQCAKTCTLLASHNDFQQIDQEKVALLQRPLCDIKVIREECSSAPLKSEETTIGALLKELIDTASSNANDDLCLSTAGGGSFLESEEPKSSPALSRPDNAAKCSAPGPTGASGDSEISMDICQPLAEEVLQQQEDSHALTKEKEGISNEGSELPQGLHSADTKVNANKGDSLTGCESSDKVQAEERSVASPSKTHSSSPVFQPSADTTLGDGSSGNQQLEEALKNGPAEGARGNVDVAALTLRPDTGDENSVDGSDILASKSSPHREEATLVEQQPVMKARAASSDKAPKSEHSGLDDGGSTNKRLPAATAADVAAGSDKMTLRGIDGEPTSDANRGAEGSKFHAAAPCPKSCGSPLHSALLDLDMFTGINILDVCGSRAEKLNYLKMRITSHSITKNEAVAEIAQSVHSAVVEEYFKRERAVRTLDLLAKIPFSLDPQEVVKIRNVTQTIVDQSQKCVPKSNCESR
uniref:Microtubule associated protein n=1 Tax=Rhipicephalus zambeziensis TaxID=60191 RepID=A0A224Z1W4_9ACAR